MNADAARSRAIVILASAVAFAAAPIATGGFGGYPPEAFPVPQVDPPMQPARWAFSIWLVIYLWLIAHAGFGLLRRDVDPGWDRTRVPMIAALILGTAWLPIARQSPVSATLLIALMLAAAVWALIRAPRADRWWCVVPIGLLAGWLTGATGASLGLVTAGWDLAGPVTATLVALVWALALGAGVLGLRGEPAYAAGIAWALVGIAAANGLERPLISLLAAAGAAALLALAFLRRDEGAPL